jgi:GWxTD domain-containing protein
MEYYKPSADVTTDKLLLRYWIANAENENTAINDIGGNKKISALDSTNAYLGILKIKNLYSGRYQLIVQILDKTMNELDRTSVTFFRNSPAPTVEAPLALEAPKNWEETLVAGTFVDSLDAASLQYSLEALQPLLRHTDAGQLKEVTKGSDLTRKKAFLLAFWRRMGGTEAQSQWAGYMKVAKEVDKKFATVSYKGFTTDRGYVYLRYGKPSNVYSRDDNFNKLPFEMWEYMDIPGNQGAVDFVFINESLAPADFKLIHSTARGEVNNPNWRTELNRKQLGNKPNSSYLMDDNRRSNSIFED